MIAVRYTHHTNGAIRNAEGKLVAFYDEGSKVLYVDGVARELYAADIEHAFDLVNQHAQ